MDKVQEGEKMGGESGQKRMVINKKLPLSLSPSIELET
jgi:hypothetical protein